MKALTFIHASSASVFERRKTAAFLLTAAVLFAGCPRSGATDLKLQLDGTGAFSTTTTRYQCDSQAVAMGLPASSFSVRYLNGKNNSLAILPVHGTSMIFVNVVSGSGARYAAGSFIWWDAAGRSTTFTSDSLAGHTESACHRVH